MNGVDVGNQSLKISLRRFNDVNSSKRERENFSESVRFYLFSVKGSWDNLHWIGDVRRNGFGLFPEIQYLCVRRDMGEILVRTKYHKTLEIYSSQLQTLQESFDGLYIVFEFLRSKW